MNTNQLLLVKMYELTIN